MAKADTDVGWNTVTHFGFWPTQHLLLKVNLVICRRNARTLLGAKGVDSI